MTPVVDVVGRIGAVRGIAVIRAGNVPDVGGLIRAVMTGGLPILELTFTIPDVLDVLRSAVQVEGGAVIGAGTVLDGEQAQAAIEAGAQFLVSPITSPQVMAVARTHGVPYIPGAQTPTEVQTAHAAGAAAVKIFPARTWGPSGLRDVAAVLPHVRLLPSGGVDETNVAAHLEAGAFGVFAGSSVAPASAVEAGDLDDIVRRVERFARAIPPLT